MGRRGPAPTPTAILKLAGSPIAKDGRDLPVQPGVPNPPDWLKGRALKVWGETVAILGPVPGLLTLADTNALAAACVAQEMVETYYGYCQEATDPMQRMTISRSLREWLEASSRLWAKFGCSPADRARNREVDKGLPNASPRGLAKFVNHG